MHGCNIVHVWCLLEEQYYWPLSRSLFKVSFNCGAEWILMLYFNCVKYIDSSHQTLSVTLTQRQNTIVSPIAILDWAELSFAEQAASQPCIIKVFNLHPISRLVDSMNRFSFMLDTLYSSWLLMTYTSLNTRQCQ